MSPHSSLLPVMVLAAGLAISSAQALTVFDPSNYAQNVIQAARALEQINNQITSLANEAQMLTNQARNLESLPTSTLSQLLTSIQRTQSLIAQAGTVGNIDANTSAMTSLVSASQSASGALQAAQAGNQLLALQSQQLSDLTALLAAKARADALEQARAASAEAQGQEQYRRFSTRSGYTPHNVTMFGE